MLYVTSNGILFGLVRHFFPFNFLEWNILVHKEPVDLLSSDEKSSTICWHKKKAAHIGKEAVPHRPLRVL